MKDRSVRFRGDKLLALEGEYRLDLRHLLHSWGAGIRLKSPREVRLRLDVLHSPEGTRVDFRLGPSF